LPTLHFLVADDTTRGNVFETLLDLLPNVDVVLNVFERSILGQVLEHFLNPLLGRFHRFDSTLDAVVSLTKVSQRLQLRSGP